jgi:DNA-binding NarL/FixJ family response regulator
MPVDVVFLSDDLMFVPRVTAQAEAAGWTIRHVGSTTAAISVVHSDSPRLLVVDLETTGLELTTVITSLPATEPPRTLAFGPHVHHQRLETARQAGCDLVVSRGRLSAELPTLLSDLLNGESSRS